MAWHQRFSRIIINSALFPIMKMLQNVPYSDTVTSKVGVDLLDEFTTQLVHSKSEKWNKQKWKSNYNNLNLQPNKPIYETPNVKIKNLPIQQINVMFENYIMNEDSKAVINLMIECIEHKKLPKTSAINFVLACCSRNGEKELIMKIQLLCEEFDRQLIEFNGRGYFDLHMAEAIWIKGDINKALVLFKEVYKANVCLRRKLRLSLKNLITNIVTSRSEVVLLNIIVFCEYLLKEFGDHHPLVHIWQYCFLSEWFSDQTLAFDLLHRNKGLFNAVSIRIPFIVSIALQSNNIEIVYRLLEYILKNDYKSHCAGVLTILFDYHLKQRNMQSCSSIVQWCQQNDVKLPDMCNEKLLHLLIQYDTNIILRLKKDKQSPKTYDFRF